MKVGDLVAMSASGTVEYFALVVHADKHETLIKWLDDGTVEDANNYSTSLEVVSESR